MQHNNNAKDALSPYVGKQDLNLETCFRRRLTCRCTAIGLSHADALLGVDFIAVHGIYSEPFPR